MKGTMDLSTIRAGGTLRFERTGGASLLHLPDIPPTLLCIPFESDAMVDPQGRYSDRGQHRR